jgi:ferredoxin
VVPRIVFEASSIGREKRVDAPDGGELVDLCDEVRGPVPFSCRSATCATCQVHVLEGADLLEPPSAEEAELLELVTDAADVRLACQARVRPGPGLLRVKPVGT